MIIAVSIANVTTREHVGSYAFELDLPADEKYDYAVFAFAGPLGPGETEKLNRLMLTDKLKRGRHIVKRGDTITRKDPEA